jgi:hypothetical protein
VDNPDTYREKVVTKGFLLIIKAISTNYQTIGNCITGFPVLTLGYGITKKLEFSLLLMYYIDMQQLETAPNSGINLLYKLRPKEEPTKGPKRGFSVLDFFVILSAFFVIGFLGYLVLNPQKEGSDERNIHRSADISSILTSITNYIQTTDEIPDVIPTNKECLAVGNEICKIGPYDCKGLVDLSFLASDGDESWNVISLPTDPSAKSVNGTGYYISQDGQGNITICAPYAERNVEISFSKFVF